MEFCEKDIKLSAFKSAAPTIEFIRIVNNLFDLMNSRNPAALRLKAPITKENSNEWQSVFELYMYRGTCKVRK